jgi:hypothetical protein
MPFEVLTNDRVTQNDNSFAGGLNTTGGPLSLQNNESSDLRNIDYNKFGSIFQRNGYSTLNSAVISLSTGSITAFADAGDSDTTVTSATHNLSNGDKVSITGTTSYNGIFEINSVGANDFVIETAFVADDATGTWNETDSVSGTHWFEYDSSGTLTRKAIAVCGNKLLKMDELDGTWDDITASLTITPDALCTFTNWNNKVFITNGSDPPFYWDGSTATVVAVPTGLTDSKFNTQFNNHLFYANVIVSGTTHGSRIYWSNIADETTFTATDFINISNDDGQEITGIKVLSDRLVIYKTRSIYNLFFTGDSDVPFVLPGGGKSNSSVGCIAPHSIQEVNNGHVFLSYDGFYFYDGNNSFKISDKINTTIGGLNATKFTSAVSLVQKDKNRYWCAVTNSGSSNNDLVLVWDYFNNAWSVYDGIEANSMSTFYVSGTEERPYFGDSNGFVYRGDDESQTDDNPLGTTTAIDAYYYTNWRAYNDLVNQKGTDHVVLYFEHSNSVLTFGYSYDFEGKALTDTSLSDQHSFTISLATSASQYGSAIYDGTDTYAATTGGNKRLDLTGRGRLIRIRFSNNIAGETFKIDGLGSLADLETNV